jgi:SAM-dependent methyltransferase
LIQDLRLDLDLLAAELAARPVDSPSRWLEMRSFEEMLRRERPMVPDKGVDCVVSNCVLNLVRLDDRTRLLKEVFRVLRDGGRAAICDIVSDKDVPERLQQDTRLWSGCLSGAFREDRFLSAFAEAGFYGIRIADRQREPWRTIEGIEFRSMTVVAYKGAEEPGHGGDCSVIYRGPFKKVELDDGRVYERGLRADVCGATLHQLKQEPYAELFLETGPQSSMPLEPGGCGCDGVSNCSG